MMAKVHKVKYKTCTYSDPSLQHLLSLHPRVQKALRHAIASTPVDYAITDGKRNKAQQQILYNTGKSQLDGTNLVSYHQTALAFDVIAYVNKRYTYNITHMRLLAIHLIQVFAEYGMVLQWGGMWSNFTDAPHFQVVQFFEPQNPINAKKLLLGEIEIPAE